MNQDYDDDIAEDYRSEQAYHNSLSHLPSDRDGMTARYWKGQDCPDSTTCDVVYIDRLTGEEVMRYDGADPANTRFDYGAPTDADAFARRGMDLTQMIRPDEAVITKQGCASRMRQDFTDYGDFDWGDE